MKPIIYLCIIFLSADITWASDRLNEPLFHQRTAYLIDQLAEISKTQSLPWRTEYNLNCLLDEQEKERSSSIESNITVIAATHHITMPGSKSLRAELTKAECSNRLTGRLCAYIEKFMQAYGIAGMAVSFIDKEKNIFINQGFGKKDSSNHERKIEQQHFIASLMDRNTSVPLACASKPLIALVIGKAVEKGFFRWEDTLENLLKIRDVTLPPLVASLTLEQIIAQVSGFSDFFADNLRFDTENFNFSDLNAAFKPAKIDKEKGRDYSYQNVLWAYLNEVVETHTPFNMTGLFQTFLLTPLKMQQSSVGTNTIYQWQNRVIMRRSSDSRSGVLLPGQEAGVCKNPFHDMLLVSTVADLTKLLRALLCKGKEICSPETWERLHQVHAQCQNHYELYIYKTPAELELEAKSATNNRERWNLNNMKKIVKVLHHLNRKFSIDNKPIFDSVNQDVCLGKISYTHLLKENPWYTHVGDMNGILSYIAYSPQAESAMVLLMNQGLSTNDVRSRWIREMLRDQLLKIVLTG